MSMIRSSLLSLLLGLSSALAAEPNSEVVVLYNSDMVQSREVAEYYAKARNIPSTHLLGLKVSTKEAITREEFNTTIQSPLWNWLVERKHFVPHLRATTNSPLSSANIRYLTICHGVPVKILRDEKLVEAASEKLAQELRRNESAVDSELASLPLLPAKPPITGLFQNHVFGVTNAAQIHPTNGVLMVGRLDGPSADLAKGLVDKALLAEKNGVWGRAYIDTRGLTSGPYESGDKWLSLVGEMTRTFGFETTVDKQAGTFPTSVPFSDIAMYFGWYDSQVSGPFLEQTIDFVPGAIAYHLYSFSAQVIRELDMNWVSVFVRRGATATVGYTDEPYLQFTLDLPAFTQRLLFRGFTFGEAAYAALPMSSWQATVVGDPLYRPFGDQSAEFYTKSINQTNKVGDWALMTQINRNLAVQPAAAPQLLVELLRIPRTATSSILMEKVGDIQKSQASLAQAMQSYQSALKLDPSVMQRLRLVHNVGNMYRTLGKNKEGYELYSNLLNEHPVYKGRKEVYEQLANFAEALGKKQEAEEYRRLSKG